MLQRRLKKDGDNTRKGAAGRRAGGGACHRLFYKVHNTFSALFEIITRGRAEKNKTRNGEKSKEGRKGVTVFFPFTNVETGLRPPLRGGSGPAPQGAELIFDALRSPRRSRQCENCLVCRWVLFLCVSHLQECD